MDRSAQLVAGLGPGGHPGRRQRLASARLRRAAGITNYPAAVLAALAAGRTSVSASRDGAVLLRAGDELIASDADGAILVGPDGPKAWVRGPLAKFPAAEGAHRLVDPDGATLALTG